MLNGDLARLTIPCASWIDHFEEDLRGGMEVGLGRLKRQVGFERCGDLAEPIVLDPAVEAFLEMSLKFFGM